MRGGMFRFLADAPDYFSGIVRPALNLGQRRHRHSNAVADGATGVATRRGMTVSSFARSIRKVVEDIGIVGREDDLAQDRFEHRQEHQERMAAELSGELSAKD
jgi:hypothetical protein